MFFIDEKMQAQMIPVEIVGYMESQIAVKASALVEGQDIVSKGNERIFPNSLVKIINK